MNMIDRFSTHLKEIMAKSIRIATEMRNPLVEPIHLLFATQTQKGSVAAEILIQFKLDPKIVEQAILSLPSDAKSIDPTKKNTAQLLLANFSETTKLILEKAMFVAHENGHNYVGTEHLLVAIVISNDKLIEEVFKNSKISIENLSDQLKAVINNASQFPQITDVAEMIERIQQSLGDEIFSPQTIMPKPAANNKKQKKKETALDYFAADLTNPTRQKNIDPVIGREKEIERLAQILCRRTKNNPILLGDPGVGKTAIVEGLAKKIMNGEVPDILLGKKVYALDMGMLIAGTTFRGEFEARLHHVIEDIAEDPNIILFIDEIHNIVGAGSNQGTMDAANILKPVLARGHLRCIGATTPNEFKKYIESDAALERRFQPIYVKQSSIDDTLKILSGIKKNFEAYHNLKISSDAIKTAVKLSDRFISNKFLPDKAIDLLDETAAAKKLKTKASPEKTELWRLNQKLEKIINAKEQAAKNDNFAEAVKLKNEENELKNKITELDLQTKNKKIKIIGALNSRDVVEQLSKVIDVPVGELLLDDKERLAGLEKELKEFIIGQDNVISEVSQIIRQAQLQLSNPDQPLASFIFVGNSGVGKTELAKILAKIIYPGSDSLIKLDMSEFNESFSISKLLGSPAGYVGYKDGNQFADKIKMNPYSVVLFDEIDKAHKDVVKLLLQILENGEITDSTSRKISLKHAIIILTTTIGAKEAFKSGIGFGRDKSDKAETEKYLKEKLKEYFSPEIINRIDKICLFNNLKEKDLVEIGKLEIDRLNERLINYRTKVEAETAMVEWLIKQLSEKNSNARDARHYVRQKTEELMAKIILNDKIKQKYKLSIADGELSVI